MMKGLIIVLTFHKEQKVEIKNINQTEILIIQTHNEWKIAWKLYLITGTEVLKIHIPHPNIFSHSLPFLCGKKPKNNRTAKPKGSTLFQLTPCTYLVH